MRSRVVVLCSALVCSSCEELMGSHEWAGTYAATGTWDVCGPLAGGRTVGDAVADLLVEKVVALSGVPSALSDQATDLAAKGIRGPVKSAVDSHVPAELAPDGNITKLLGTTLASLSVESTITLEPGTLPKSMKGKEDVTALEFRHNNKSYRLTAADLYSQAGATIVADWEGKEKDNTLEVDPHSVKIQYGELVSRVASQVLDAAGQSALRDKVVAAVSCSQIVSGILGGSGGFTITVASWSYTCPASDLEKACASAAEALKGRALGLFALDSRVEVGGNVTWKQPDGTIALRSGAGFGGVINVAPKAIAPRVTVAFSATRR